jgi:hypothetical protein
MTSPIVHLAALLVAVHLGGDIAISLSDAATPRTAADLSHIVPAIARHRRRVRLIRAAQAAALLAGIVAIVAGAAR